MDSKQFLVIEVLLNFIAILLGFFLSINLSTILGQTGDWGILSSGILTAFLEVSSLILYNLKKLLESTQVFMNSKKIVLLINFFNTLKIGILYGFFVESFKLGS